MNARFYGAGIGYRVRGLFLDGVEAFYRTAAEDKDCNEIDLYGDEWRFKQITKARDEGREVRSSR